MPHARRDGERALVVAALTGTAVGAEPVPLPSMVVAVTVVAFALAGA